VTLKSGWQGVAGDLPISSFLAQQCARDHPPPPSAFQISPCFLPIFPESCFVHSFVIEHTHAIRLVFSIYCPIKANPRDPETQKNHTSHPICFCLSFSFLAASGSFFPASTLLWGSTPWPGLYSSPASRHNSLTLSFCVVNQSSCLSQSASPPRQRPSVSSSDRKTKEKGARRTKCDRLDRQIQLVEIAHGPPVVDELDGIRQRVEVPQPLRGSGVFDLGRVGQGDIGVADPEGLGLSNGQSVSKANAKGERKEKGHASANAPGAS
jgi:hypothetical protein